MKPIPARRMVLGILCAFVISFATYTLFVIIKPIILKTSWEEVEEEENIPIPDVASFALPISEIFEVKRNTTYMFKVSLVSNVTLDGSIKEAAGMCINFYVLDETNLKRWLAGRSFSSIVFFEAVGKEKENFTFTTEKDGNYYFVLDNMEKRFSYEVCQDKYILFELKPRG
ncbi:hypothetical protein KEJ36_03150 [Candidatus Bathyarchaeota archaeon]|nr:hypothetical protein [Candidatus Bathyarchaeota archaeon]MBS7627800.1 hypothetical protein [Candidatus Bathyarchaeota archaeon]